MKPGLILIAAAAAATLSTPASADFAAERSHGWPGWTPDTGFPSTPPIQRYGKGRKGVERFGRGLVRDAEYARQRQDSVALRPAASRMEDSRGKCDRMLKQALESGDQAEIAEKTEYCRPKAYGPQVR